jgi:Na+-transporting NADH:ubiquinone oxidoreductase subunit NqrD
MNALADIWHELVGLFIEDGSLALAILGVVAAAAIAAALGAALAAGIVLLVGCLAVLAENVLRAGRVSSRPR